MAKERAIFSYRTLITRLEGRMATKLAKTQGQNTEFDVPTRLGPEQIAQFIRDGYVVVPGLLPAPLAVSVRRRIEEALGMSPDDPATWTGPKVPYQLHALTTPCRTAEVEAAAAELVGPHFLRGQCFSPYLDALALDPIVYGYIPVLTYPQPGPPAFVPPNGFHIDGIHTATLLPDKHYLVILAYLSDTAAYGG